MGAGRGSTGGAGQAAWVATAIYAAVMAPALALGNLHWDAWIHHVVMLMGDPAWIVGEFSNNGRPVNGPLMLAAFQTLGLSHGPLWVAWLSLALATGAVAFAGARSGLLQPHESVLVALFVTLNPAHQMMFSSSGLHFFTALAALCVGLALSVQAQLSRGSARLGLEAGALVFMLAGAATGDSVAFLVPLVIWVRWGMLAAAQPALGGGDDASPAGPISPWATLAALWRASPAQTLLCAVPAVLAGLAFVIHFQIFRPNADFEPERRLALGVGMTLEFAARFAVAVLVCYLLVWLAMGALSFAHRTTSTSTAPGTSPTAAVPRRRWTALAWLAVAACVLALLPYWLADRKPTITGWSVRFLFTLGPALGLACVVWLRRQPQALHVRLAWIIGTALALCLAARWPLWLDRQVKDDAVLAVARDAARSGALPQGPQTVCVFDMNPTMARPYRDFEWTGMWMSSTARRDVLAIQPANQRELPAQIATQTRLLTQRYPMLAAVPPDRCTVHMLLPEPRADWPVTVAAGAALRWVWPSQRYEQWLLARYPASALPR